MSVVKFTDFIISFNSVLGIFNISQKYFASVVLKEQQQQQQQQKSNFYFFKIKNKVIKLNKMFLLSRFG